MESSTSSVTRSTLRREDLLGGYLVEVKRRLYKVALLFLKHALLLDRFNNVFQLLLSDGRLCRRPLDKPQSKLLDLYKKEYDWTEQLYKKRQQPAGRPSRCFRCFPLQAS